MHLLPCFAIVTRMEEIREMTTDILIVGAGAAGLAVFFGVQKAGGTALLCDERDVPGGILPQCIHKGFGLGVFGEDLSGPEYLERYLKRMKEAGVNAGLPAEGKSSEKVSSREKFHGERSSMTESTSEDGQLTRSMMFSTTVLSLSRDKTALLSGPKGLIQVRFRELVVATGCREKPLYALPVEGPRPSGIYTAGEAQELVNLMKREIGNRIVILGSGDIGQIMARRFTLLGKKVLAVIEKNDHPGGLLRNQKQCLEAFHIPVILSATVTRIHGMPSLSGVTVSHSDTGKEELIACDTLVTSLGLIPDRTIADGLLADGQVPSWVHFAGNADHVHEIVDSVTREGEALGEKLARSPGKNSRQ